MTLFSTPNGLSRCDAEAQITLERELRLRRPLPKRTTRDCFTGAIVTELPRQRDRGVELATGEIPVDYRITDMLRTVLFRENATWLIPAFEECGILHPDDFVELRVLFSHDIDGYKWRRFLARAVGLDREDINYHRLLRLVGWPEAANCEQADDTQMIWAEGQEPNAPPTDVYAAPASTSIDSISVGGCHLFWLSAEDEVPTVIRLDL
ncbi:hypothetical protein BDZ89DRAFT_1146735 [Hymenopellis radicata]|nr:hypothetical protein BDZ89DRAFT_1146735 [Hymenopellis radicata]